MSVLITGGLGFIGSNAAIALTEKHGQGVIAADNYFRPGVEINERDLNERDITVIDLDVTNYKAVHNAIVNQFYGPVDAVIHLAAQTSVPVSVTDPVTDLKTNIMGTFNVLDAVRRRKLLAAEINPSDKAPCVIYASTNKVYGGLSTVAVEEAETRYRYVEAEYDMWGTPETLPLDPISPYGCSKMAAEHYVTDFARIYGLNTVSFRQSCIYGPRQLGSEEQGWAAWFVQAVMEERKITIYGDGKQVRDMLYVDDLVDLYVKALQRPEKLHGQVYNAGGGPLNTISIWAEGQAIFEYLIGKSAFCGFEDWRPGDQKIHVSDIRKAHQDFGWSPKVSILAGLESLYRWVRDHREELAGAHLPDFLHGHKGLRFMCGGA